ncbi:MAG TPA: hypothetical protein VFV52_16575 [Bacilli bacterium]|nr:hypothetical protein [Bacilli bacterium]
MGKLSRKVRSAIFTALFNPLLALIALLFVQEPFGVTLVFLGVFFLLGIPLVLIVGMPIAVMIDEITRVWPLKMVLYALAGGVVAVLLSWLFEGEVTTSNFIVNLLFFCTIGSALFYGVIDNVGRYKNREEVDLSQ